MRNQVTNIIISDRNTSFQFSFSCIKCRCAIGSDKYNSEGHRGSHRATCEAEWGACCCFLRMHLARSWLLYKPVSMWRPLCFNPARCPRTMGRQSTRHSHPAQTRSTVAAATAHTLAMAIGILRPNLRDSNHCKRHAGHRQVPPKSISTAMARVPTRTEALPARTKGSSHRQTRNVEPRKDAVPRTGGVAHACSRAAVPQESLAVAASHACAAGEGTPARSHPHTPHRPLCDKCRPLYGL